MMRDVVSEFADLMDHRLDVKMDKYGGDTWLESTCSNEILIQQMKQQVEKLEDSLKNDDFERAINKTVDIANLAMMIDNRLMEYFFKL